MSKVRNQFSRAIPNLRDMAKLFGFRSQRAFFSHLAQAGIVVYNDRLRRWQMSRQYAGARYATYQYCRGWQLSFTAAGFELLKDHFSGQSRLEINYNQNRLWHQNK